MRKKTQPEGVYQHFIDFEEEAAEIYVEMASHFCPENRELASFWLEMGMQEKQHSGLLQFCAAERLFAPDLPSESEIHKLEKQFLALKKRANNPGLSAREAFEIAMGLETSEINAIYSHLTTPVHNSMYLLRRKVMTSLPDHVDKLAREARKHGVRYAGPLQIAGN
jgi:rubrerythrin